jgi:hypothetical protein
MSTAFIVGDAALVFGTVIVTLFLRDRARDHDDLTVTDDRSDGEPAPRRGNGHSRA